MAGAWSNFVNLACPLDIWNNNSLDHEGKLKALHSRLVFLGFAARKTDNDIMNVPNEAQIGVNINLMHTILNRGTKKIKVGDWLQIVYPDKVDNERTIAGFKVLKKKPENIHRKCMVAFQEIPPNGTGTAFVV